MTPPHHHTHAHPTPPAPLPVGEYRSLRAKAAASRPSSAGPQQLGHGGGGGGASHTSHSGWPQGHSTDSPEGSQYASGTTLPSSRVASPAGSAQHHHHHHHPHHHHPPHPQHQQQTAYGAFQGRVGEAAAADYAASAAAAVAAGAVPVPQGPLVPHQRRRLGLLDPYMASPGSVAGSPRDLGGFLMGPSPLRHAAAPGSGASTPPRVGAAGGYASGEWPRG